MTLCKPPLTLSHATSLADACECLSSCTPMHTFGHAVKQALDGVVLQVVMLPGVESGVPAWQCRCC